MTAGPSRRAVLAGGLGAIALAGTTYAARPCAVRIRDDASATALSPLIYGSNENGTLLGERPSAEADVAARVTARRLGGNLMTTYNWVNNAANSGVDWHHFNAPTLLRALQIPQAQWTRPAVVIEKMHETSLAMGAASLVTLPLAGYVAADMLGAVQPEQAAPSARFVPVRWESGARAGDPIDRSVADIPQLLARVVERFGTAGSGHGIKAYALDNEAGLWFKTHPRLVPQRMSIGPLLERSITAARAIKAADPTAQVFGPASWGAPEMADFQDAPDWPAFRHYGSFIAAYLDAFRSASERAGMRLLDVLDVHWYPQDNNGDLYQAEREDLAAALLDAPRSLSERGFREKSWVPGVLPVRDGGGKSSGVSLPLLPSLRRLVDAWFPGTHIAVTEFAYGGAGQLASGLALADVLGRFGAGGVYFAAHWGNLEKWLGEAYRLYRVADSAGAAFGDAALPVEIEGNSAISAYAARGASGIRVVLINKSTQPVEIELIRSSGEPCKITAALGFDAAHPVTGELETVGLEADARRIQLAARAARRFALV